MASFLLHYSRPSPLRPQQNSSAARLESRSLRLNVVPLRWPLKVHASSSRESSGSSIGNNSDNSISNPGSDHNDGYISVKSVTFPAKTVTFPANLRSHLQSAASRILLPSLLAASLLTTEAMLPPHQSILPPQQSAEASPAADVAGVGLQWSWLPLGGIGSASANGLLQMPPIELKNTYYLVRAGESEWEAAGLIHTNPVDKTNVQSGLSGEGKKQAIEAARKLRKMDACGAGCWIWPSISQRAYQTAEVVAYVNGADYSRIVPEYSFLDARGLGAFEGQPLEATKEIYLEDSVSSRWRPPPFSDGTPHESVADVLVRVTQLMSILETQYSREAVVIVSPDSDCLSVLQSALIGKDIRSHSDLYFQPGEVRRVDISNNAPPPPMSGLISLNMVKG
ncbi:hypothetical protein CLOM_g3220 [Closterium sp. NIES-68]|nr:hypothetical protein CLOM_g3220 [Closterium sp. NIES-68]GJP58676.1 hypothetical protein CLOP_g2071 [Closterium sp. NIES-67]GJP76367.1 hypothetical protein CLOP_g6822 [Closterium sp. NIES-67]